MAQKRRFRHARREILAAEDAVTPVLSEIMSENEQTRRSREDSMDNHRREFEDNFYADPGELNFD